MSIKNKYADEIYTPRVWADSNVGSGSAVLRAARAAVDEIADLHAASPHLFLNEIAPRLDVESHVAIANAFGGDARNVYGASLPVAYWVNLVVHAIRRLPKARKLMKRGLKPHVLVFAEAYGVCGHLMTRLRKHGVDVTVLPNGAKSCEEHVRVAVNALRPTTVAAFATWVESATGRGYDVPGIRRMLPEDVVLIIDGAQALGAIPVSLKSLGGNCVCIFANGKWLMGPLASSWLYLNSPEMADGLRSLISSWGALASEAASNLDDVHPNGLTFRQFSLENIGIINNAPFQAMPSVLRFWGRELPYQGERGRRQRDLLGYGIERISELLPYVEPLPDAPVRNNGIASFTLPAHRFNRSEFQKWSLRRHQFGVLVVRNREDVEGSREDIPEAARQYMVRLSVGYYSEASIIDHLYAVVKDLLDTRPAEVFG